ncbi:MAG: DUF2849 domain-containing protein [Pseudomonadota bacterium]
MARPFTPKVVTANHLLKGDVVYQALDGWTRHIQEAEVLADEAHADLRLIEATQQTEEIVGAYLADVQVENGVAKPTHFREDFRATGPSNYHHGKQTEQA